MDHTLSPLYTQLTALAAKHGAQKLVLFGSRARGDHTERSDIDLAVYGMPPENPSSGRIPRNWTPFSSWISFI